MQTRQKRFLKNATEIMKYIDRSESTLMKWINHEGFPAAKDGKKNNNAWESDTEAIDKWMAERWDRLHKKNDVNPYKK